MNPIVVVDYDPAWPHIFAELRDHVWPAVSDFALGIEHVGSTSVPGLAAKPVIDIDIIVTGPDETAVAIERLAKLGYEHRGDMGVPQREAFRAPAHLARHNLYVTSDGSECLRDHRTLRDHLRSNPESAREYGELKKHLASIVDNDMERYIEGKTDFILSILAASGSFSEDELDDIRRRNQANETAGVLPPLTTTQTRSPSRMT